MKEKESMIVVYYVSNNSSGKITMNWLDKHHIVYKARKITKKATMTVKEVKDMLLLTENGFEDLINHRSKLVKQLEDRLYELKTEELIGKIIQNPTILKLPIILDEKKIVMGCNENELRCFLSRNYRQAFLMNRRLY